MSTKSEAPTNSPLDLEAIEDALRTGHARSIKAERQKYADAFDALSRLRDLESSARRVESKAPEPSKDKGAVKP